MKRSAWLIGLLAFLSLATVGADTPPSRYRVAHRFPVEGDGFWDLLAVDDATGRLFLSHGSIVQILDTRSGKLVGTIPNAKGVHAIALARDLNKGFVTCGRDTAVLIFNLETLAVIDSVTVTGGNPDAILYEPLSHRVFAFNGRGGNATVIDGRSEQVIGTVPLNGRPELGVADRSGMIFVNLEDKSMVDVIRPGTLTVAHRWPLGPGTNPTGIAIDDTNHRLFVGCANKMMVILNSDNGKLIATLPIGDEVDGVAFDPGLKRAYSSNGDGTLTAIAEIDKNRFQVMENVPTQKGARTMAVDDATHHIFLPTAEFGEPPPPTPEHPRPWPSIKPGSFAVLDIEPVK